jgi:hypothetical protein
MTFTESTIEQAAIDWVKNLGYDNAFGPEIAFNGVVRMVERLRDGLSLPRVMRVEVHVKDVEREL